MASKRSSPATEELAKAINAFGVHLYQTIKETRDGENMFFSPLSISTAMAMTHLGARGDTAKQIAEVFRFNKIDGDELHQTFKKLDNALFNPDQEKDQESRVSYRPPRYRFLVSANKLYGKSGFPFVQSFLDDTARFYDSGIEAVDDFTSPSAIKSINDWVSERTEGKINSLLDPGTLDQLTRLLLVNAIYFKAKWSTQFPKRFTREDFFKVRGERERIFADTMRMESMYKFALDIQNECKVLSMYFKETNLTMMIALPDKTDGLPGLESKLSVDLIHSWIEHLRYRTVTVFLPKFKIREQYNLKEALQSMGISDAFDERRADFSGVTGARDLDLSALVHKTFVEINEEGCEAAAVTIMAPILYGASRFNDLLEPVVFRADHPFLFIILHDPTKAILFIGRLVDPSK